MSAHGPRVREGPDEDRQQIDALRRENVNLKEHITKLHDRVEKLEKLNTKKLPRLYESTKEPNVRPMFMIISYAFGTAIPMEVVERLNGKPFILIAIFGIHYLCDMLQDYAALRYAGIAKLEGKNPPRGGWLIVLNIFAYLLSYSLTWFAGMIIQVEARYWHMDGPFPAVPVVNTMVYLLLITALIVITSDVDGIPPKFASSKVRKMYPQRHQPPEKTPDFDEIEHEEMETLMGI